MIVISGALVLVALVLLVIGIVGPELGFVYASIGVSLVSLVFLVIGILQRRGETLPGEAGAGTAPSAQVSDPADSATTVIPTQARAAATAPVADSVDDELEYGGTVLVVAGRPRYHVAGCRYLSGKDAEGVDVLDAREEGFTPCGVCKPDDALDALAVEEAQLEADEPELELVEEQLEQEPEPAPVATSRRKPAGTPAAKTPSTRAVGAGRIAEPAPAKAPRTAAAAAKTGATGLPAKATETPPTIEPETPAKRPAKTAAKSPAKTAAKTPAKTAATTAAKTPAKTAATTAAKTPAKTPSKAALAAIESTPAAAAARKTGSVVVIPDRGRFHRPECRYVRGVDGAEVLSKAAATRQGFDACGVCKP